MMSNFDVLKVMSERNLDIRGFPLSSHIQSATVEGGVGRLTMNVDPETALSIVTKKPLIAILIVADKEQFDTIKKEINGKSE